MRPRVGARGAFSSLSYFSEVDAMHETVASPLCFATDLPSMRISQDTFTPCAVGSPGTVTVATSKPFSLSCFLKAPVTEFCEVVPVEP
ncbi:hypothetical protein C6401_06050 [Arthrobacter woluwensis]|nr:hypothetical protein C6401_06050 [Arthrobacter woluwensis]